VNILDENIIEDQRTLLLGWRLPARQIGQDIGHQGMKDIEQIIPLLQQLSRPTFFTRDIGFFNPQLCHAKYCLVSLTVSQYEVARFIRRFPRHSASSTWARRSGCVVKIGHMGIWQWRLKRKTKEFFEW
jgi:hypothetical protein